MQEIHVLSTKDKSLQPSLFYKARGDEPRPLLVGLHTWSGTRTNQVDVMLPVAKERNWNLLLPEFRGPNLPENPICRDACGSALAKQDILDAVQYVTSHNRIDEENILLLGGSGGGHMALLMAALSPTLFKAIASFVPITDLTAWYAETVGSCYHEAIAACCGGSPDEAPTEYESRSPICHIDALAKANLRIFHGKYDDTVPVTHSLNLYAELMQKHPASRVFLDIFDGGHQMNMANALDWFDSQMKNRNLTQVKG